jgi:hypothetical protein
MIPSAPWVACCLIFAGAAPDVEVSASAPAIGVAHMLENGTILVGISAPGSGPDAPLQAVLMVEPGDTQYEVLIAHIGGLKPGETKSIPPWPDQMPKKDEPADPKGD